MRKQKKLITIISAVIFSLALITVVVLGITVGAVYRGIDFEVDEKLFESSRSFESTTFYANGGGEEYTPIAIETSGGIKKIHYGLNEISPYLKRGFVAVEDKIFYRHCGVDFKRTVLAAINLLTGRKGTFGASTITQQVIKNISGDNQIAIRRKVAEIIRALHVERIYSKDEILEVYCNIIPMGDNIYGVGAASRAYFGKEPSELSVEEAATLIGITNAPTAYSPYLNPERCRKKRDIVLGVMYSDGVINESEYKQALKKPLAVIPREKREDVYDSWFVETAIDEICRDLAYQYNLSSAAARTMLLGGGYKVYTTMNPRIQSIMEDYFENIDNLAVEARDGLNYAMVITDVDSGDLLGIIGRAGKKSGNRLLNHALVPHIPASTLKPLALYAPLIDIGELNWATVFDDVPVTFTEEDGEYKEYPRNSPNVYDGLTTVKDAVRLSKNTIAVRLSEIMGPRGIYNFLVQSFGMDSLVEREGGLTDVATSPMALGQLCRGVPLIKLTEAYGVFPSGGIFRGTRSYLCVYDHSGNVILRNEREEKTVFKESTARIMNLLLKNVVDDGTAASISLKEKTDIAGKTGTSGGNRDKLFVGYTPSIVAGIWCGYDNATPVYASKSHLKIWDEVMNQVVNERERFSTDSLLYLPYCRDSGGCFSDVCLYDPRGNRMEYGYFTEDNKPAQVCDRHVICMYDSITKAVACDGCPPENLVKISLIKVQSRAFPKEIIVTDAEFVYRNVDRYTKIPIDYSLPYFQSVLPDGVFVGKSKGKKQFNSGCYLHCE